MSWNSLVLHFLIATFSILLIEATDLNLFSRQNNDLENFVSGESPIALQGILNNIGANGSLVEGASSGIVVASPSTQDPNYFYTWTRDSALTFKFLIDSYVQGNFGLGPLIQEYILAQGQLQTVDNLSGTFSSGAGLGEPKFYTNETAFEGEWGRPQRDGPALRATAMIAYSKAIMAGAEQNTAAVHDVVWPIVSNDLNYVAEYWNQTGFDLWEEVNGSSFFTTAVQYRALIEGADFAQSLNEKCDGCVSQAPNVLCFLQDYWNGSSVTSNINLQGDYKRSGLDCNSILTSIHMYDPESGCTDTTFQPCSSRALSNHKAVIDSFRGDLYTVNSDLKPGQQLQSGAMLRTSITRLYSAVHQWNNTGSITVDDINSDFFNDIMPNTSKGEYKSDSPEFSELVSAVREYGDGFIATVQKFTPEDGSLAEQYSRENGTAVSARDLTWSYASFLTTEFARNSTLPQSWGESKANKVPDSCQASSAKGTYVKPEATKFPDIAGNPNKQGTATGSGAAGSTSSAAANRVKPFFRL